MGADMSSSDCIKVLEQTGQLVDRGWCGVYFRRQGVYETREDSATVIIRFQKYTDVSLKLASSTGSSSKLSGSFPDPSIGVPVSSSSSSSS